MFGRSYFNSLVIILIIQCSQFQLVHSAKANNLTESDRIEALIKSAEAAATSQFDSLPIKSLELPSESPTLSSATSTSTISPRSSSPFNLIDLRSTKALSSVVVSDIIPLGALSTSLPVTTSEKPSSSTAATSTKTSSLATSQETKSSSVSTLKETSTSSVATSEETSTTSVATSEEITSSISSGTIAMETSSTGSVAVSEITSTGLETVSTLAAITSVLSSSDIAQVTTSEAASTSTSSVSSVTVDSLLDSSLSPTADLLLTTSTELVLSSSGDITSTPLATASPGSISEPVVTSLSDQSHHIHSSSEIPTIVISLPTVASSIPDVLLSSETLVPVSITESSLYPITSSFVLPLSSTLVDTTLYPSSSSLQTLIQVSVSSVSSEAYPTSESASLPPVVSSTVSIESASSVVPVPTSVLIESSSGIISVSSAPVVPLPVTSIGALSSSTSSTANWLPTSLIFQKPSETISVVSSSISATTSLMEDTAQSTAESSTATAIPSYLPKVITPSRTNSDSTDQGNSGSTLVQIGFKYGLNYPFVVANPLAASQIFAYLLEGLDYALDVSTTDQKISITHLAPLLSSDRTYLATIALVYVPSSLVSELGLQILTPTSNLYNPPSSTVRALMGLIDSTVPLIPDTETSNGVVTSTGTVLNVSSSTSTNTKDNNGNNTNNGDSNNGAGAGSMDSTPPVADSSTKTKTVGIVVGSIAGAAAYGGVVFMVIKRMKTKKVTPSIVALANDIVSDSSISGLSAYHDNSSGSTLGSGSAGSLVSFEGSEVGSLERGRVPPISNPVMTQNSLGWS